MKSIDSGVCHRHWSISWSIVQAYSQTRKYQVFQFEPNKRIFEQFVSKPLTNLQQSHFFLFEFVVVKAWRVVTLYGRSVVFVRKFAMSFHAFLCMIMSQDYGEMCALDSSEQGYFFNTSMDLAYMCVKPQMRLYVCQALRLPNTKCVYMWCHQMRLYVCHQMRLYVCHQMRLYVCHQMRLYVCHQMCLLTRRSSLRSLTFARFARTFFNSLN